MRRIASAALLWSLLLIAVAVQAGKPAHVPRRPRVVHHVDLERFCGTWHEIARMPTKHQKDCACCVTATYALREDGKIAVTNRCVKADGEIKVYEAEAEIVDTRTNARWKFIPFKIFGLKPVKADMWVIGLDEDYAWMVVGNPDRDRGWIMARKPELEPEMRAKIDALLKRQGYDLGAFVASSPRPVETGAAED